MGYFTIHFPMIYGYYCPRDSYFVDVTWVDSTSVHVTWLNREQNTSVYAVYDTEGAGAIKSYYESNIHDGWVELVSVYGQCTHSGMYLVYNSYFCINLKSHIIAVTLVLYMHGDLFIMFNIQNVLIKHSFKNDSNQAVAKYSLL